MRVIRLVVVSMVIIPAFAGFAGAVDDPNPVTGTPVAPQYTDWSVPVNVGSTVNTTFAETNPAFSPDGLSLYFDSNRPGGSGGRDLWVSRRATATAAWGAPVDLGTTVNSSVDDANPALSSDGHWLFFVSSRVGGFGASDLYESYRADVHDDLAWQAPVNLGAGVNTASNENGTGGYFDNGGHPQLYFGSNRAGGPGGGDIYMATLDANGTWGSTVLVSELSSTSADNRPNLRADGLEIFLYSSRAGGQGGTDLWSATRASTDVAWSAPVDLGAVVNTAGGDLHPYVSTDGRTLVFDSDRAGGAGDSDLWVTTRAAKLTVTADDQSRLFGQANPPLTVTITGFVGGETASAVSGTPSCTTTATAFSPAGDYPISCTAGTLGAAGYSFATFVAGTLTVSNTRPCLSGRHVGPLTVAGGEAVCFAPGGSQTGPVRVAPGGSLDVEGGRIIGPVTATDAATVRICGASITGPVRIDGSTGLVLVGGDAATGPCDANTILGPVTLNDNGAGVEFNGNSVVGPVRISGTTGSLPPPDAGAVHAVGNSVIGSSSIQP
jgi:hypothetical protein